MSYDVVVIGSGPGGYVAAVRAAQLGLKTACVEKEKSLGGTCLNVGCIPSKALLQSSEHYAFIKNNAQEHGIEVSNVKKNLKTMMERKTKVVKSLTDGVVDIFKRKNVDRIEGAATFISKNEIEVSNGNETKKVESKYFILATGSAPIELPFLKFDEKIVLSSTGSLSLPKVPKELLVVGAGVIGVEIASVYNRLGSKVTIVEMLDHITPGMDKDIIRNLYQSLRKQGLEFHLGSRVISADVKKDSVSLKVETEGKEVLFKGDVVLVAIGRKPYTEGLGLESIGVDKNSRGQVEVDSDFRTSIPNIFAIGDIIDGPMLAHKASEEGTAAAEAIAGLKGHVNYMAIPNVIYTHPEAVAIGLTEQEAKEKGLEIITGTCSFKANPRARCAGDTDGLVKVIGEKNTKSLLGLHLVGPHVSEMAGEGVIAFEKHATIEDIAKASHAHPTLCEAIKEACQKALGFAIHL